MNHSFRSVVIFALSSTPVVCAPSFALLGPLARFRSQLTQTCRNILFYHEALTVACQEKFEAFLAIIVLFAVKIRSFAFPRASAFIRYLLSSIIIFIPPVDTGHSLNQKSTFADCYRGSIDVKANICDFIPFPTSRNCRRFLRDHTIQNIYS